jgi:2-dehydro-3-deoxygluconokinase
MPKTITIASIGECMLELSTPEGQPPILSFGGDTLNTAVYMARLGAGRVRVDYLTALGDDPYSEDLLAAWAGEGIGTDLVARIPGRLPGLYAIRTDAAGERSFYYWREQAAARAMFDGPAGERLTAALPGYDLIYLSGITVSILPEGARVRLCNALDAARAAGARVGFDSNYRLRGWPDAAAARKAMDAVAARADIVLPSLDDERALRGIGDAAACLAAYRDMQVGEICVKDGANGCLIHADGDVQAFAVRQDAVAVDTTAAGDSFNAAYLTARLNGASVRAAADAGHLLAARVIGHRGAIIDKQYMPDIAPFVGEQEGSAAQ